MFFNTYVFQAGLVGYLVNKFKFTIAILFLYFILCLGLHIWTMVSRIVFKLTNIFDHLCLGARSELKQVWRTDERIKLIIITYVLVERARTMKTLSGYNSLIKDKRFKLINHCICNDLSTWNFCQTSGCRHASRGTR